MKNIFINLLLILAFVGLSQQEQIAKKCQYSIQLVQSRSQILFDSFKQQDFDDVVAETIIMDKYLEFVIDDCPVIFEKKEESQYQAPLDCQKNIHLQQQLFQGDIVSNFQLVKDINDFFSSSCLPSDYMHKGFQYLIQEKLQASKGNNFKCVACNALVSALGLYIQANNPNLHELLGVKRGLCKLMPGGIFKTFCLAELGKYGKYLIQGFENNENSDQICRTQFQYCVGWEQCNLHGHSNPQPPEDDPSIKEELEKEYQQSKKIGSPIAHSFMSGWLKKLLHKIFTDHLPISDLDGDRFSTKASLRGYNWRGKDCSPYNKNIYPGRKKFVGLKGTDFNCNGIKGYDHNSGVPYKDQYCYNSKQMGTVVIGDSAGAHFSLPPQYLNGALWNKRTFDRLQHNLENEFDVPNESSGTGYESSMNGHSFYLKLLNRNRCNRNDYQNLGVNGASSRDSMPNMLAIARKQRKDNPVMVFWELVGNDVCGRKPTDMTEPMAFRKNILELWNKLDSILPRGSHMVVTGVADGRILYDCLHNRTHPIGVTYTQFYNFLNCMDTSPCSGWMNSDEKIRNQTTARAQELNEQYKYIINTYKFQNFDVQYYDMPMKQVFDTIEERGGKCWDGIEPSDGFHPSELSDQLWADILWKNLERDHPDWLGPINPHNQDIINQFGDGSTVDHILEEEQEEIELQ